MWMDASNIHGNDSDFQKYTSIIERAGDGAKRVN